MTNSRRLRHLMLLRGIQVLGSGQTEDGGDTPVGPSTITWNPSDKNAAITLSNGNLDAAGAAGWISARATISHNSGMRIIEMECTVGPSSTGYIMVGLMKAGSSLSSYCGAADDDFAWQTATSPNANFIENGTNENTAVGGFFNAGKKMAIGHDFSTGAVFAWVDGVAVNSGAAVCTLEATGQTLFPAVSFLTTGNAVRIRQELSFAIPSGYSYWGL